MKSILKHKNQPFLKRVCAFLVSAVMTVSVSGYVFADEAESAAEDRAAFVSDIVNYLSIYARYEKVMPETLYKEGLMRAVSDHPEIYESVLKGMLESIDEHSEYYNPEEAKLLKESISGTIIGIGITFQMCPDGVEVQSVIDGTPAHNAGVQVGDVIVSADGTELAGMNSDTAASYIRGEAGTSLSIGIKRTANAGILYLDVLREEIIGTSVASKVFEDGENKLMYIRVSGFVSNTADKFKEALDSAAGQGITNIIIDLRNNGGGLFDQAIRMADYLVPKGSVITTEDHKIKPLNHVYKAMYEDTENFSTVVLINEYSASASEVLSAALSENECATLIGTRSYGKGTIQTVADLFYGDSIKYTVGYYLTPLGNNINGVGLNPDTYVENTLTPFDMTNYTDFGYVGVYKVGDSGEEVKNAKRMLAAWGVYDGEINDVYDDAAASAVYKFQSSAGLFPYGELDLTTQHELYTRLSLSKVNHDNQLDAAFEHFGMKLNAEQ